MNLIYIRKKKPLRKRNDLSFNLLYQLFIVLIFRFWKTVVVDPSNENYFYWSMIVMFAVLYNTLFIVLRCVFPQPHEPELLPLWFVLDYICDFIYLIDMFIKSRIGE